MPLSSVPLELELAVTILEDETRRAIFDVLWRESWQFGADDYGIRFEELQDTVGVESSSRLSYHLERMKAPGEPYVEADHSAYGPGKTPTLGSTNSQLIVQDDDRYYLDRQLGQRIVQLWGLSQPEHDPVGPTTVPWDCPYCDRQLSVTYRNHRLDLWCEDHGGVFGGTLLPGDARGYSPGDLVHLAALDKARDRIHLLEGVCMACWGPVDGTVVSHTHDGTPVGDALEPSTTIPHRLGEPTYSDPDADQFEAAGLARTCQTCHLDWAPGLAILTCYRPAAANFFTDHGIDIYSEPMIWRFVQDTGVVTSLDPLRLEVVLQANETTRTLIVDEACRVVAVE